MVRYLIPLPSPRIPRSLKHTAFTSYLGRTHLSKKRLSCIPPPIFNSSCTRTIAISSSQKMPSPDINLAEVFYIQTPSKAWGSQQNHPTPHFTIQKRTQCEETENQVDGYLPARPSEIYRDKSQRCGAKNPKLFSYQRGLKLKSSVNIEICSRLSSIVANRSKC